MQYKNCFVKLFTVVIYCLSLSGCGGGGGVDTVVITTPIQLGQSPGAYSPPIHVTPTPPSNAVLVSGTTGYMGSLSPSDLLLHYAFPTLSQVAPTAPRYTGKGQTIVIIDGPGPNLTSSTIRDDLTYFDNYYNLPNCNFQTINPNNLATCSVQIIDQSNGAQSSDGYQEMALDLQWAHAMAPGANILLIVTPDNNLDSVMIALQTAVNQPNVVAVSMSFGAPEFSDETTSIYDGFFRQHPNIAFVASSGDSGGGTQGQIYPAASPYVTAVGGTTLLSLSAPSSSSETSWVDGGGGPSVFEPMPSFQVNYMNSKNDAILRANNGSRAVPDVAYNADPQSSPVAVRINGGWSFFAGTSAGAPQWAGILAGLAEYLNTNGLSSFSTLLTQAHGLNSILYQLAINKPNSFYNVASGNDGNCGLLCAATVGYNDVTGLGVPLVSNFYANFASYAH